MYGKFFASAFTGSMFGAGAEVFATWAYSLANTKDGTIELNPDLLAAIIGASPLAIEKAITFLCAPDPRSRSKAEQGRRLLREGEFAYRVVNWEDYQKIRNEDERREYNRAKQREYRAKKRGPGTVNDSVHSSMTVNDNVQRVPPCTQLDIDKDVDVDVDQNGERKVKRGRKDSSVNNNTTTTRAQESEPQKALKAIKKLARSPKAFTAMLKTINTPITGGRGFSWPVIGAALVEFRSSNADRVPTAAAMRAYCRRLENDPTVTENGKDAGQRFLESLGET